MSRADIVHLESYRKRRDARFKRTLALHGNETDRSKILHHLWRAVNLVGADRAGLVWIDEYGPGLAHPHTVLDLGADRPRRVFSPLPLRTAWDTRVPGFLDLAGAGSRLERSGDGIASACCVALGSDGPRFWFVVVDSLTPRPSLTEKVAGELMFLAGEVASVVLHGDLGQKLAPQGSLEATQRLSDSSTPSFPGWPVLKDLEGCRNGCESSRTIGNRFLVARLVRGLLEDDFVIDRESIDHQVKGIRGELGSAGEGGAEAGNWDRILRAALSGDLGDLLAGLLEWGRAVEEQGHLNGALEILEIAYELAKALGSSEGAADAARFQGKVYRTRAEWDQAGAWYGVARRIAEETSDHRKVAAVLDGLANTFRDRGNLPRARETLMEVLEMGRAHGDRYALAIAHHDLMTVEKLSGDLLKAIRHGWLAVQAYDSREGGLRALFDLSGVLRESGELSAARNGYTVVAGQVDGFEYRILALDALAFIAALHGDPEEHDRIRIELDSAGWDDLSPVYRGQVLYFRGLSSRALGRSEEARKWLKDAMATAEAHGLNKLLFDIEETLLETETAQLPSATSWTPPEPWGAEIVGVRQGLRDMREALADAGSSP